MKKRVLSMVLAVAMVVSVCFGTCSGIAVTAFAVESESTFEIISGDDLASVYHALGLTEDDVTLTAVLIFNGHYYWYSKNTKLSWEGARTYCENLGGHLATITSQEEQDAIYSYISSYASDEDIWIGINDIDNEGDWSSWITGEEVTYTNWGTNEPDDAYGGQDYGVICNGSRSGSSYSISAGQWDDVSLSSARFLCEWDSAVNPFVDVSKNTSTQTITWYYYAVIWASDKGITAGTSDTTFSPNMDCSRAQIVTFLWRAAGSPEPTTTKNPFTDVKKSAYYYKAVLWAVEKGITAGTSSTTFSPDKSCTRAEAVTFLYRYEGSPSVSSTSKFTDVGSTWYTNAVAWAVKNGITAGTTKTTFSPNTTCSRAMIVTFLYRYIGD